MNAIPYSDDQLVEQYIKMRDFIKAEAAAQMDFLQPTVEGMTAIQNELHRRLLERNPNWKPGEKASAATASGTFFMKTNTLVKVAERNVFLAWVFQHNAESFLTSHVAKDAVEAYVETYKQPPPGVTIEQIVEVQIRKS